jgi:hypothetical protein
MTHNPSNGVLLKSKSRYRTPRRTMSRIPVGRPACFRTAERRLLPASTPMADSGNSEPPRYSAVRDASRREYRSANRPYPGRKELVVMPVGRGARATLRRPYAAEPLHPH